MSDGGRDRAWLGVEVWKSFHKSEAYNGPPACSRKHSELAPAHG